MSQVTTLLTETEETNGGLIPQLVADRWPVTKHLDQAIDRSIQGVPVDIASLTNPDTCPAPLLPVLAHSLGMRTWDSTLTEEAQRERIKHWARFLAARLGTSGAVEWGLADIGVSAAIEEWWEADPEEERGTFCVRINPDESALMDRNQQELIRRTVDWTRRASVPPRYKLDVHREAQRVYVVAPQVGLLVHCVCEEVT